MYKMTEDDKEFFRIFPSFLEDELPEERPTKEQARKAFESAKAKMGKEMWDYYNSQKK